MQTKNDSEELNKLVEWVAVSLDKNTGEEIVKQLVEKGFPKTEAAKFVKVVEKSKTTIIAAKHRRNMIYGIFWLIIGLGISISTYIYAASQSFGGKYVVMYGAVIVGLGVFLKGLIGWLTYKKNRSGSDK